VLGVIEKVTDLYRTNISTAEKFLILVCMSLLLINVVIIAVKGVAVFWAGYAFSLMVSMLLIGVGLFYRLSNRSKRISLALFGAGLYIWFSVVMSTYNYLLLPLSIPTIDPFLVRIDAFFGYHWPDLMIWASENPIQSNVLKFIYMSTIGQIMLLILWHGFSGRAKDLHNLLVAMTVSAVLAICFWGLFPSLGPAAYYDLPPEIWNSVRPVVGYEYAQELKDLAANGPSILAPDEVRGLIAFPSFHAVLAFIAIWSSRKIKYVFPVFLIVNLLMMPATLIHGGHHLIDLPAGFVTFLLGIYAAKIILRKVETQSSNPLEAASV